MLEEIQVTIIYSLAFFVSVISDCSVKRVIFKAWTGTLENSADPIQTPQNEASDLSLHSLYKLQAVKGKIKQS